GVKTADIPVTIREEIPEPIFTLKAPARWDGRETIEVVPQISNSKEMQAKGAGNLNTTWTVSNIAVIKEMEPGKLILKRAQNSGKMTVTATLNNGGQPTTQAIQIVVKEPEKDAWVHRTPGKDEKPVDNQFYARDDKNEGTLYYNGSLPGPADSVFLKVYADDEVFKTESQELTADKTYAFSVKLKPGLTKYKVEFGSQSGNIETVLHTVTNLVCGDAYIIDGQSNAVATDWGQEEYEYTSDWIRSFGSMGGDISKGWGGAVRRRGGAWQIGYWGMDLAKHLVETQKIPICIINGAVGGTLIEMHQRNPAEPTDPKTIYGRLLRRVESAGLTHGIRGVFWHQGENDQQAQGASGGYGWETYRQYFVDMSAAWKEDYPNIQRYYVFQIWPNSCSMGGNGASDKLRDVQRTLPRLYSNMSVTSTLGIKPVGTCHYPAAGYAEMARLISLLVERDQYGKVFDKSVAPPDLQKAYYTNDNMDEIALEFDQPMAWNDALTSQFYLDGKEGRVESGAVESGTVSGNAVSGNVVKLKLASATAAKTITYLVDKKWDANNLLYGQNGIAALTFCEVPIDASAP
ncbi:MAG TPA: sialate O-acetylesterase, partial [Thermoguttaceae bacterium]|nr:sialate O-acetylesterase [Thermoguttaceae bacterium]